MGWMKSEDYPWKDGVFNPACVCGGSINRPNSDCERCAMHDWVYKIVGQNDKLKRDCEQWFHLAIEMFEWFSPDNLTMQAKQREWAAKLCIDMEAFYGGQDDE